MSITHLSPLVRSNKRFVGIAGVPGEAGTAELSLQCERPMS